MASGENHLWRWENYSKWESVENHKEWHFRDSIVRDVITWCEIPTFKE